MSVGGEPGRGGCLPQTRRPALLKRETRGSSHVLDRDNQLPTGPASALVGFPDIGVLAGRGIVGEAVLTDRDCEGVVGENSEASHAISRDSIVRFSPKSPPKLNCTGMALPALAELRTLPLSIGGKNPPLKSGSGSLPAGVPSTALSSNGTHGLPGSGLGGVMLWIETSW